MFSQQQDNMEAAALCFRLLTSMLLLLAVVWSNVQKVDADFPLIDPNRLQFFEYESISVHCEELDPTSEWRVMRKCKDDPPNTIKQETSTGSITLNLTFASDSGEYWCENKEGGRSSSVNITVTAGDVILQSPAVPVMEGDDVNLYCRHKMTASKLPADFYKDGLPLGTGYLGNFPIHSVSQSDEGFYKCSISGGEESAESWLAVRANISSSHEDIQETPETTVVEDVHSFILPPLVVISSCVAVALLVMGLLHCHAGEESVTVMSVVTYTVTRDKGVPGEASVAVMSVVMYAVTGEKREPGASSCSPRQTSSACTKRQR